MKLLGPKGRAVIANILRITGGFGCMGQLETISNLAGHPDVESLDQAGSILLLAEYVSDGHGSAASRFDLQGNQCH